MSADDFKILEDTFILKFWWKVDPSRANKPEWENFKIAASLFMRDNEKWNISHAPLALV